MIYSAFLVEEEGTASTLRGCSKYSSRMDFLVRSTPTAAVIIFTPTRRARRLTTIAHAGGPCTRSPGIEHIPAYSPEARGRSERMFGTLQDRLVKELAHAGIADIETANQWIREVYLPAHNARFAKPAAVAEKAFVPTPRFRRNRRSGR